MKTVVTIGGSDSAGCSGIQADIKAISAFNLHAACVLTSVTAQNTQAVIHNQRLETDTVRSQLEAIVSDLSVGAIKIGLLGNASVIRTIAEVVDKHALSKIPIIVDPVISSSTGQLLLDPQAQQELLLQLLPCATLFTPNCDEAQILTGIDIQTIDDAINAGRSLLASGCGAILIKGGHFTFAPTTDVLVLPDQVITFPAKKIPTANTRGTGCSLASAIAACMATEIPLVESIRAAKNFVRRSIAAGYSVGSGPGPIDSLHWQRYPILPKVALGRFHAITDQNLQTTYSHLEVAKLALEGGADVIQYRDKANLTSAQRIEVATELSHLCKAHKANLIINDRTDIARSTSAAGVHLGKNDLSPTVARHILGPNAYIGKTANSYEEALAAEQLPIDYLGVGPIFKTTSKSNAPAPLGLATLEKIAKQVTKPIIAIGGIEPELVGSVIEAGAYGIAILSGLWKGSNPLIDIQAYSQSLQEAAFEKRDSA